VFSMVRVGDFLYRAGWVVSGLLLFDFPPTIFAYFGFVARLTNVDEMFKIGFSCTAIACLSWLAGRTMGYVLARIGKVKGRRRLVGSCRFTGRPLIAPNSFAALALEQPDRLSGSRTKEASYKVRTPATSTTARQHLFSETDGGWLRRNHIPFPERACRHSAA
jgi:hypothetical protein